MSLWWLVFVWVSGFVCGALGVLVVAYLLAAELQDLALREPLIDWLDGPRR